jgi:alcohol dehydrogenase, propanol-preferring
MKAMVFEGAGRPLVEREIAVKQPSETQVLLRVLACGVCRTDLHVVDGELARPKLPLIPGHQIVARVEATGTAVSALSAGDRVGVPWLGYTCGVCTYCSSGRENLCASAGFTGYTLDGGFAEYVTADARYCFPIPEKMSDVQAAPLLCAGLIGYRALRMTGDAKLLGLYGFGSAAHIITQVAVAQNRRVFAFTRPGDDRAAQLARDVGATWAGDSTEPPPRQLDAAIIFAPVGELVPTALAAVAPGCPVICAGIHMSPIPSFPYSLLWNERVLRSVANLTRSDGDEFLPLAASIPVQTHVETFDLADVNTALDRLRRGDIAGSAVLDISG